MTQALETIQGTSVGALKLKSHPNEKHGYNRSRTVGMHPMYRSWQLMNRRCRNKKSNDYRRYGERGITVCTRWTIFTKFLEDMGASWFPGATIDRIDNNKGYSLNNCRWATRFQQANNTSRNVYIDFNGKSLTPSQWSRETGIPEKRILWRYKNGWSAGDIFTKLPHEFRSGRKPHNKGKLVEYFTKTELRTWLRQGRTQRDISKSVGCPTSVVSARAVRWGLVTRRGPRV